MDWTFFWTPVGSIAAIIAAGGTAYLVYHDRRGRRSAVLVADGPLQNPKDPDWPLMRVHNSGRSMATEVHFALTVDGTVDVDASEAWMKRPINPVVQIGPGGCCEVRVQMCNTTPYGLENKELGFKMTWRDGLGEHAEILPLLKGDMGPIKYSRLL